MGDKIEAKKHAIKAEMPILESVNDAASAKDVDTLMIKEMSVVVERACVLSMMNLNSMNRLN